MREPSEVDDYGLPITILGSHPDQFYGAMGRVVCVCAVLEEKVTTLRHTLARVQQGKFTHEPVSGQIAAARGLAKGLPEEPRREVDDFLAATEGAFRLRNDLVHSSFPAQANGRIWGHRATRDKAVTDGTADTVGMTLEDLFGFVVQLADLVLGFNRVHALVTLRDGWEG